MNLDALDISILGPAFLAGLLVVATHVPLGRQVLARGIIFIDLAVAQMAGLGIIAAHALGWDADGFARQFVAFAAALVGSVALYSVERRWPAIQEPVIGVSFVLAATAGILVVSADPHGAEYMHDILAGQILWVRMEDLWPVAVLYALVLALWFGWRNRPQVLFYGLFAVSVTASVQLVGVYLVFASLILPALAVRSAKGRVLALAYGIGVVSYALGLAASALLDLPTGPAVVWMLALLALGVGMVMPWAQRCMIAK